MNFRINYPTNRIPNFSFLGRKRDGNGKVLVIDTLGNYSEYKSASAAAASLKAPQSNVTKCLKGKSNYISGYAIAYAEEFLTYRDGKQTYDLEKMTKYAQDKLVNNNSRRSLLTRKFVAYNIRDLQPKVFNNLDEAQKELCCSRTTIIDCADGKVLTRFGHVFLWADEILDKKGNIDIEKGKELTRERVKLERKELIDSTQRRKVADKKLVSYSEEDFQPKIFNNLNEAANKLYYEKQALTNCADGKSCTCGGYIFFWADELLDENGNIDLEKGKKLAQQRLRQKHINYANRIKNGQEEFLELYKKPVILYDRKTLKHQRIGTIDKFCEKNPDYRKYYIARTALGKSYTYKDKVFVFEDDITEYDPMGNKIIDIEKGRQIAKERIRTKKTALLNARNN